MKYNPTINCAAYSPDALRKRLQQLNDAAEFLDRPSQAPNLYAEKERIEQALADHVAQHNATQNERVAQGRRAESYQELKARYYPSQMNTTPEPGAAHVRAIVGPNNGGGSAASLSFGYSGR